MSMKKYSLLMAVTLSMVLIGAVAFAQMGPGMMGGYGYGYGPQGQGGWNCPNCGYGYGGGGYDGYGYGMGPGMMNRGYGGYGMGPGMMYRNYGPGYNQGYNPGYGPGYGPGYNQTQNPVDEKQAKAMIENYLSSTRNPNLKLGKIEDKGGYFEGDIVTQEGSLVDKIAVNKSTGAMRSIY